MAIGNVLHRTAKTYVEGVELDDYDQTDWIHNPDLSAVDGVPVRYWKITGSVITEMSQAEKVALDAPDLATFKLSAKDQIRREMLTYIDGKYDSTTFSIINALELGAQADSLTNRRAYLDDLRAWVITLIQQQDTLNASIDACTTLEAIEAVVWDFSSFDASNPGITPSDAIAIPD